MAAKRGSIVDGTADKEGEGKEGKGKGTKSLRELDTELKEVEEKSLRYQAEFEERSREVESLAIDVANVEEEAESLENEVVELTEHGNAERERLNSMLDQMGPLLRRGGDDLDEKLKDVMTLTRVAEERRLDEQRIRRQRIRSTQQIEELRRSVAEERRMQKMLPGRIRSAQNRSAELLAHWTSLGRQVAQVESALEVERGMRAEEDRDLADLRQTVDGLESAMDFARRRYHSATASRDAQGQSFCMARQLEANELRNELASTRALLDKRLRELSTLRDSAFKNGIEIQALKGENIQPAERFFS